MIPDCRSDDYYNQDFLDGMDNEFIRGYDWCAEEAVDCFFDNLDTYFVSASYLMHMLSKELPKKMQSEETITWTFNRPDTTRPIKTYSDYLRAQLREYMASERDELTTSMIDNMDEELYKARRNKVLKDNEKSDNPKEYSHLIPTGKPVGLHDNPK